MICAVFSDSGGEEFYFRDWREEASLETCLQKFNYWSADSQHPWRKELTLVRVERNQFDGRFEEFSHPFFEREEESS